MTTLTNTAAEEGKEEQADNKTHKHAVVAEKIPLSNNFLKTLSTRERIQMRINNYNHSNKQEELEHQYIEQYKRKQHGKFINEVVKK